MCSFDLRCLVERVEKANQMPDVSLQVLDYVNDLLATLMLCRLFRKSIYKSFICSIMEIKRCKVP